MKGAALIALALFAGIVIAAFVMQAEPETEISSYTLADVDPALPTQPPPTTTTTEAYDFDGFADATCELFETALLVDMVDVAVKEGLTEFEALTLIGAAITYNCPEQIEQFVFELNYTWTSETAQQVIDAITGADQGVSA